MSREVIDQHNRIIAALTAKGAPFELTETLVGKQRLRVFRDAADGFPKLIDAAVARHGERVFLREGATDCTFAAIDAVASRLSRTLRDRFGLGRGDRVGIAMRNRREYFAALFAVAKAGLIGTLLNSRGAPDEIAAAANDVGCRLIFADMPRAIALRAGGYEGQLILASRDEPAGGVEGACAYEEAASAEPLRIDEPRDPDEPAWILFTSGTSGRPKGATLTHRNIGNVAKLAELISHSRVQPFADMLGTTVEALQAGTSPPASLQVFPLFHISGLISTIGAMLTGGSLILMRRWNSREAADLIHAHSVALLSAPPMALSDLVDLVDAPEALASLRTIVLGGQATPENLRSRIRERLPNVAMSTGWGMTEACGNVAGLGGPLYACRPQAAGFLGPLMEVRVVNEAGRPLPRNASGELQVRGALLMQGYWERPDADAEALVDGWYRTGDVGTIDEDGFVHIVDRLRDMVISAGENIYCAEIERVLSAHDDVAEVAVFGVPDERLGERAVASVRLRTGAQADVMALRLYASERLADYKVPREIDLHDRALPRNALGKVSKRDLLMQRTSASA